MRMLLPCPFCGNIVLSREMLGGIVGIICKNEKCGAIVTFNNGMTHRIPSSAIKFYNQRKGEQK